MNKPLISLIIPTRERCDTLQFSLQTALNQKSKNYEIVVSDNFSQDDTKKIVESFDDPRINYFNTGKRMSMCDNWGFACDKAKGEFIIIIGDDDGVIPGGIDYLEAFIQKNPAQVYFWDTHIYTWPIKGRKPEINKIAEKRKPYCIDLKKQVRSSFSWGGKDVDDFPKLYHSAVAKNILEKIKHETGKMFHAAAPDMFMAYAIPTFADMTFHTGKCITSNGRSAKSNSGGGEEAHAIFLKEIGDYKWHPTLDPNSPGQLNYPVDSALVASELFPDFYENIEFNYSAMWVVYRKKLGRTIWDIIKNRNKIRRYHPFHISIFIYYLFAHYASTVKRKYLERKSRTLRRKLTQGQIPNNILKFVNLVEKI